MNVRTTTKSLYDHYIDAILEQNRTVLDAFSLEENNFNHTQLFGLFLVIIEQETSENTMPLYVSRFANTLLQGLILPEPTANKHQRHHLENICYENQAFTFDENADLFQNFSTFFATTAEQNQLTCLASMSENTDTLFTRAAEQSGANLTKLLITSMKDNNEGAFNCLVTNLRINLNASYNSRSPLSFAALYGNEHFKAQLAAYGAKMFNPAEERKIRENKLAAFSGNAPKQKRPFSAINDQTGEMAESKEEKSTHTSSFCDVSLTKQKRSFSEVETQPSEDSESNRAVSESFLSTLFKSNHEMDEQGPEMTESDEELTNAIRILQNLRMNP